MAPRAKDQQALEQLAALLLERAGLKITPDGYYGLRLALSSRMPALGLSDAEEYVRRLRGRSGEHELRSLLPLVTVGKTEFFRDTRQFHALERRLFPAMLSLARREGRQMSVWSAGCATGEEPYSLAIIARELGGTASDVDIWATDLNPAAVESARKGIFPVRRLAGVSAARRHFFTQQGENFEVRPELKGLIRFEGLNLASPVFPGVKPSSFDLVLCRNVIIYFDLPTIQSLMQRFWDALRPGGVLLLGYSESLFRVYDRFEMFEVEGSFAYRRPLLPGMVSWQQDLPAIRFNSRPPKSPAPAGKGPARVPSSAMAAPRSPPRPQPAVPEQPPPPVRRNPHERLEEVKVLVEQGKFELALTAARALVKEEPDELRGLLTLGNIQSLMALPDEAMASFQAALAIEPLCVEARVFGAMSAYQAGRFEVAREELTKALFLEPTLAIGHYLLAQVEERRGDLDAARRSYRNVLGQARFAQRPLAGHYPDLFQSVDSIAAAAGYALAALSERDRAG